MKCQRLLSGENKKYFKLSRILKFFPSMQSLNLYHSLGIFRRLRYDDTLKFRLLKILSRVLSINLCDILILLSLEKHSA